MNFKEIALGAMYGKITSGHPSLSVEDAEIGVPQYQPETFNPKAIHKPWNKITAETPELTPTVQGMYRDIPKSVNATFSPERQRQLTIRQQALQDVRNTIYKNQGDLQKSAIEIMDKSIQAPDGRYDEFINQMVPGASEQLDIEFTPRGRALLSMDDNSSGIPTQENGPLSSPNVKASMRDSAPKFSTNWRPQKDRGNFTKRVESLEEMEVS